MKLTNHKSNKDSHLELYTIWSTDAQERVAMHWSVTILNLNRICIKGLPSEKSSSDCVFKLAGIVLPGSSSILPTVLRLFMSSPLVKSERKKASG